MKKVNLQYIDIFNIHFFFLITFSFAYAQTPSLSQL